MSRRWGHSQQTTPAYLRLDPFVFWGKRMILIKSISIIDRVEPGLPGRDLHSCPDPIASSLFS
jgi:hypothetical protein